eukprot:5005176-Ditylum_brightwellii.AAC.1
MPLEALKEPTKCADEKNKNNMLEDEWKESEERVEVITEDAFPYLGMQMSWMSDNLHFLVYSKENQTIKHMNKEGCYRQSVFKAILPSVFVCLDGLTLLTQENKTYLSWIHTPYMLRL